MKNTVYFSNSPKGARKTKQAYQKQKAGREKSEIQKEKPENTSASQKQNGIYNQWLLLCGGLCLSFLLLISSGDRIKSFSTSDGVEALSGYIKEKIEKNDSMAVFFGFEKTDGENIDTPAFSKNDIPVFEYGEGLKAEDYIEKYNNINYTKTGAVPVFGVISSEYSFRKNPFYEVYSNEPEYEFHSGIDIAADEGENILCYLDGTVEKTALSASYGYYVSVDHGNGLKTLYAHASEILCEKGDKVSKGEIIAKVGSTGRATGSHLHFEVTLDGSTKNPKEYLGELYEQS